MTKKYTDQQLKNAFQKTLAELSVEMPRASFDTWVRDLQFLRFDHAKHRLHVGTRNAYAADWLASRLTEKFAKIFNEQISDQGISVVFDVSVDDDVEPIESIETESEEVETPALETRPDEVAITLDDYETNYGRFVQPHKAIYLNGYFKRWLKHLGPDLAWMYVAIRQCAYLNGSRSGYGTGRFSGKQISALSGISERTFWRRAESPDTWEKLNGLVKISDNGAEWDNRSSTPKRIARRYTVAMDLALTPTDTQSLMVWIKSNMESYDGIAGVLKAIPATPLETLFPANATATSDALTVRKSLHNIFSGVIPEKDLDLYASAIQNHIMPDNDQIKITLFFLETVLPHIGAGAAWMLTLLRDMCFDSHTERRNQVTVKGGYAEIAGWLGMSRPRSIYDWLNADKKGNDVLKAYLTEIHPVEQQLDFDRQPRTYTVLLEEMPQSLLERAIVANDSIGVSQMSQSIVASDSIAMSQLSQSVVATFSIVMSQLSQTVGADVTVKTLNSLKPTLNSLIPPPTNTDTSAKTKSGKVAVNLPTASGSDSVNVPSAWEINRLLNVNRVTPKKAKDLRAKKASGSAFVSWVLYALSDDGAGITSPVGYAISRLEIDSTGGAGGVFDTLATMQPKDLIRNLTKIAKGHSFMDFENRDVYHAWLDKFGRYAQHKATIALSILMGEDAPYQRETRVETISVEINN